MQYFIGFGVCLILFIGIWLNIKFYNRSLTGQHPSSPIALFAILFTSGLDGGFILLPLLEFKQYQEADSSFSFTNPLAIELGFWGFTAWALYYVSALYFLTLEPKYRWFDKPVVKIVNGIIILTTCAFTLSLFLTLMPHYVPFNLSQQLSFLFIAFLIIIALRMSESVQLMTVFSQLSMCAFGGLTFMLFFISDFNVTNAKTTVTLASDYLIHLDKFILPFNEYHEFYLAWWLTWSIMLGQFVARFVKNMSPLKLLWIMTLVPLIPSFIWFSVLYFIDIKQLVLSDRVNLVFLLLGVAFVVNSLDFMVAQYSTVFKLNRQCLGRRKFMVYNALLLLALTWLFQYQILLVQYTAALVICLICYLGITSIFVETTGMNIPTAKRFSIFKPKKASFADRLSDQN